MQNATATRSTAAMLLATNLRERLMDAPFAELAGMDGERFSPPIDAQGNPVDGMERYGQAIRVVPVYPDKLSANTAIANEIPAGTYTGAVRVTVAVTYGDSAEGPAVELYHLSWVRLDH